MVEERGDARRVPESIAGAVEAPTGRLHLGLRSACMRSRVEVAQFA